MSNWRSYSLTLISDGKFILFITLIERLVYFIFYVYTARSFDEWIYGNIVAAFAFANILYSLHELGLNTYIHRYVASRKDNLVFVLNNIFSLKLLTVIPYSVLTYLYIYYQNNKEPYLTALIAMVVFLIGLGHFLQSILFGKGKYKTNFYYILVSRFLFVLAFIVFIYLELQPVLVLMAFLIMALGYLILEIGYLKKLNLVLRLVKIDLSIMIKILRSSLQLGTGVLFVMVYDKIDVVIIQELLGAKLVAVYAVAYAIYKLSQIGSSLLLVPAFTNLSRSFQKANRVSFNDLASILIPLFTIIAISMIGLYFTGLDIIVVLFGSSYIDSKPILDILIIAIPFLLLNNTTGVLLNSAKKELFPFITTFVGMILNIITCVVLIDSIGVLGAAIATLLTELTVFILQLFFIVKLRLVK